MNHIAFQKRVYGLV